MLHHNLIKMANIEGGSAHRVTAFLGGLSLHLNHLYSGASERSLSAIWDTSHWNFFVKFGLRTA